uniref:Uncharacterized protein n=1 Tax=Tanacetum cinerariifolium TaxID=118510 RepID=A0A699GLA2_TANCI|nr:hypothetical protein [Tanacetum cinerariifolium]
MKRYGSVEGFDYQRGDKEVFVYLVDKGGDGVEKLTLGLRPIYTSCFSRVNMKSLIINYVPKKLHDTDPEITLGELGIYSFLSARAIGAAPRINLTWNSTGRIGGRPGSSLGKTFRNSLTTVPSQMTHLVASITLDSSRSCVMQGAFLTQGIVIVLS